MEKQTYYINQKKNKEKKKLEINTDKVLIVMGVFLFWFIVTMIVIYCVKDSVPDSLIYCVMGGGMGEAGICARIWHIGKEKRSEENE